MSFKVFNKLLFEGEPEATGGGLTDPATPPAEPATPTEPEQRLVTEGWLTGVDETLSQDPSIQSIKDLPNLVKSYINAQKLIGKDKIPVPDQHASDEDWQGIYDKLGRPKRDDYKLAFGENEYDENFQKGFSDVAHSAGLMPHQAQKVFDYWNGQIKEASDIHTKQSTEAANAAQGKLREEWGAGYDKELETARIALRQFANEDQIGYLRDSGLGNDPQLIRLFNAVGKSLNEDTFQRASVSHLGMTKDEASEKLTTIMGNSEHPYWNSAHPGHGSAVKEVSKLHEVLG